MVGLVANVAVLHCICFQSLEVSFTRYDVSTDTGFEASIPISDQVVEEFIFFHFSCYFQAFSKGIHTCDMSVEQIFRLEGCTSYFSVKVYTTCADTTIFENFIHSKCYRIQISWEFVCIPAKQHVALVRIDRTEHIVDASYAQFVFESMSSECSMVSFKVKFKVFVQAVFLQECNSCSCVKVVLVF
ncbi:hypothetical protein D3C78_1253530 [compost metagenome]